MALMPQTKVSTGSETICGRAAVIVPTNMTAVPMISGLKLDSATRPSRTARTESRHAPQSVATASRTGTTIQGDMP